MQAEVTLLEKQLCEHLLHKQATDGKLSEEFLLETLVNLDERKAKCYEKYCGNSDQLFEEPADRPTSDLPSDEHHAVRVKHYNKGY